MASRPDTTSLPAAGERSHFSSPGAVTDSLRRPMAERLELAISWNRLASELQRGMERDKRRSAGR